MKQNDTLQLDRFLSEELVNLFQSMGRTAHVRSEHAYLVGGIVRDILLGRKSADYDVAVEGKAIALARQIARNYRVGVKTHPHFGTARLFFKKYRLDLVTARRERYARPGALPVIEAATILDDLARRDFSINAIAISLAPETIGNILDPHGGRDDLSRQQVRILHPGSFRDDPTRILRAIRYEQRLGFSLEHQTSHHLLADLKYLREVTGERLWHELELILEEECAECILERADKLGVLAELRTPLHMDRWLISRFAQARRIHRETLSLPGVYLALVASRLTAEEVEEFISRFRPPGWAARVMRQAVRLARRMEDLRRPRLRPSKVYHLLKGYLPEAVRGIAVASDSKMILKRTDIYLWELADIRPELTGDDLQKMGVSPGRKMGQILARLRDASMDGLVTNRKQEQDLVRRLL